MGPVKELRIGVVGTGTNSYAHMPHLVRLGHEVKVLSQSGAEDLVERFGGSVVDALDELLKHVDVVDVNTPETMRAEIVERSLEAGCDVICENPLSRDVESFSRLIERAVALGRQLHVTQVTRYLPQYERLHSAVAEGLIGSLAVQRYSRSAPFPAQADGVANQDSTGDILFSLMIHDIDTARWIAGEVVRVVAARTAKGAGTTEAGHVLLTHESGIISHVAGSWGPSHIRFKTGFYVGGTAGVLRHNSLEERDVILDLPSGSPEYRVVTGSNPGIDPFGRQLEEVLSAIAGGPRTRVTAEDSLEAVRIASTALRSLEQKEFIDLEREARSAS